MAKPNKGKYHKTGTKISLLTHELRSIGAFQAMRKLMEAAEVFHEDVERIEGMKDLNQKYQVWKVSKP
jgi:hypothetical protein